MHPFEFVIAIVSLVFLFKLLRVWIAHKASRSPAEDPANGELLKRLSAVEERVRVLERIVTDERFDLKQQFRDLGSS